MTVKLFTLLTLSAILTMNSSVAVAQKNKQAELDKACEAARQVALKPRRKEIYKECRDKFKKSESVCKKEAKAFNGNRINGAPMFYELPPCEKAFEYRKKQVQ